MKVDYDKADYDYEPFTRVRFWSCFRILSKSRMGRKLTVYSYT